MLFDRSSVDLRHVTLKLGCYRSVGNFVPCPRFVQDLGAKGNKGEEM